jgi:ribonuclease HI
MIRLLWRLNSRVSTPISLPFRRVSPRKVLSLTCSDVFLSLQQENHSILSNEASMSYPLLHLFIDGASKGNPGAAGIGVLITAPEGEIVTEIGEYIGQTTNNVAEYRALIRGLKEALMRGAARVIVQTDSQLLARQVEGKYKINAPHLRVLREEAVGLCRQFPGGVTLTHVLRGENARADALANQGARAVSASIS